jgi:hypothetical protein
LQGKGEDYEYELKQNLLLLGATFYFRVLNVMDDFWIWILDLDNVANLYI